MQLSTHAHEACPTPLVLYIPPPPVYMYSCIQIGTLMYKATTTPCFNCTLQLRSYSTVSILGVPHSAIIPPSPLPPFSLSLPGTKRPSGWFRAALWALPLQEESRQWYHLERNTEITTGSSKCTRGCVHVPLLSCISHSNNVTDQLK